MKTNPKGVALIKRWETFSAVPYLCPAGVWTIGWGHTGDVTKNSPAITEHQADAILEVDLDTFERIVDDAVKVPLTSNQFSALVSFVFNVGPGRPAKTLGPDDPGRDGFVTLKSGKPSTMLRLLNAGDYAGAALQFDAWVKAAGKTLKGLVNRRAAERALFEVK